MAKIIIKPLPDLIKVPYYQSGLLSKSSLWDFKAILEGRKLMKAKAETLRFGQLFHEAIYEPFLFVASDEYIRVKVTANPADKDVKLINHIERMAVAAKQNIILNMFLKIKGVQFEVPKWALINGVPVQIKMDCFTGKDIHDAKSTACTSYDQFVASCLEYGYFEQGALYKLVSGAKNIHFLGVSKAEPHKTFAVDCSKFKAEMKAAEGHILGLIEMYCDLKPKYKDNALKLWKL